MAIVQLFHSTIRSSRVVYPNGTEGAFIDGRLATSNEDEIAYLDSEIAKGHPNWHRNPELLEVDDKFLDPMEALKAKIIAEAIEAGIVKSAETSEYTPPAITPSSSADLTDVKTQEEAKIAELTGIANTTQNLVFGGDLASLLQRNK